MSSFTVQCAGVGALPHHPRPFASCQPARLGRSRRHLSVCNVASPPAMSPVTAEPEFPEEDPRGLSAPAPFSLKDVKNAIPDHCFKKDAWRSVSYLFRDIAVVGALAAGAYFANNWFAWPIYWMAQSTMFWALFVVGHDCGHQSFSDKRWLNDLLGNIVHSSILVPYHGWRISHRTHHANHGHVENDESWHPTRKSIFDEMTAFQRAGRLQFPLPLLAYPAYLFMGSPGHQHSHFDPNSSLFKKYEANMIRTSNAFLLGMLAILGGCTFALGPWMMFKLYVVPYVGFLMWLDTVTYLHHHGNQNEDEKVPWYRGERWNYLQGGLSTLDRDYGIFNNIHHDIGTHVVHHLFSQIPHYHLIEATEATKPVIGKYYREPEPSPGPIPTHLVEPLVRSFNEDHYVEDEGDVVFYKKGF